jgi:hypothetical protein
MAIERGEYRPIYEALFDGPDFERLSTTARLALIALKVKCGPLGIRVITAHVEAVRIWTGSSFEGASEALQSLISEGWIEVDGTVVWVVRGLEFEPSQHPKDEKHQKFIERSVKALPSREIVQRFCRHYQEPWKGLRSLIEAPLKALGSTSTSTSNSTSPSPSTAPEGAEEPQPRTFPRSAA